MSARRPVLGLWPDNRMGEFCCSFIPRDTMDLRLFVSFCGKKDEKIGWENIELISRLFLAPYF